MSKEISAAHLPIGQIFWAVDDEDRVVGPNVSLGASSDNNDFVERCPLRFVSEDGQISTILIQNMGDIWEVDSVFLLGKRLSKEEMITGIKVFCKKKEQRYPEWLVEKILKEH